MGIWFSCMMAMQGGAAPNIQVGYKLAIRGNSGNHGIFTYKGTNMQLSSINMFTVSPSQGIPIQVLREMLYDCQ